MLAIAMVLLLGAAPTAPLLTDTGDLDGLPDACVVDTRALADYAEGHIPGAVHLDATKLSHKRKVVEGILRPPDALKKLLAKAGVDPRKRVVVYSDMADANKRALATRLFWILEYLGYTRVSVLDGGIGKWKAEGRELARGKPKTAPIELSDLKPAPARLATHGQVAEYLDGDGVVADLRPPNFFRGCTKKKSVTRYGRIPGACSLPIGDFLIGECFEFKQADELRALFEARGIDTDTRLITYCNSSYSATAGYFAARLLGIENVSVYDGAMAEWSRLDGAEMATGD